MRPILRIRDLSKTFVLHLVGGKEIPSLRGVQLDVHAGEFLAVIGRTGSGKSTLLKSICGICAPTHGALLFGTRGGDGEEIDLARADDVRLASLRAGEIGYVAQHLHVIPRVAALDVAAEPLLAAGVPRDEAHARARALLRSVSLPAALDEVFPSTFSPGERQRLNLARALALRPRLLLVDEPTSALDPLTKEVVLRCLAEVSRSGTTVIGVFHDMDVVQRLAHRVVLMEAGRLIRGGTPKEVLPVYLEGSTQGATA